MYITGDYKLDIKDMKSVYYTENNASLINFEVVFHFVGNWLIGGVFMLVYFRHPHVILLFLAAYWLLDPSGYKHFYYRWKLFKYNAETLLSIETERNIFAYQHKEHVITFCPSDIEKWWKYECGPYMSTFVKIIELRLRDGKKVIISSGLDSAIDFIYDHSKELGFPEESPDSTHEKFLAFKAYIDEFS